MIEQWFPIHCPQTKVAPKQFQVARENLSKRAIFAHGNFWLLPADERNGDFPPSLRVKFFPRLATVCHWLACPRRMEKNYLAHGLKSLGTTDIEGKMT